MKVTYQTCYGVDVHNFCLVATIVKTTGGIEPAYRKKRFSSFNNSILEFKKWLLTRNGVCLKPALVQCAHATLNSDKSLYYKKKYESLVKRCGKKRAIIAIARMILTAIYQMLFTGEVWNPSDLYKINMPTTLLEKQKAKATRQAKNLLQTEGLFPPDEPLASCSNSINLNLK